MTLSGIACPGTSSGFGPTLKNIGSVENRGVELALTTINVNTSAFLIRQPTDTSKGQRWRDVGLID